MITHFSCTKNPLGPLGVGFFFFFFFFAAAAAASAAAAELTNGVWVCRTLAVELQRLLREGNAELAAAGRKHS